MRKVFRFTAVVFFVLLAHRSSAQEPSVVEEDTVSSFVQEKEEVRKSGTFSAITQTPPVAVRKVEQENVEALQKSDDYWYANLAQKEEPEELKPRRKTIFDQAWFWNLLWILIICGFIAVVIWYLASSNIRLFRKAPKPEADEAEEEAITDDIFSINYDREISKAEAAANYRLAVRLWYLLTLKELSVRNIINYRAEKPNGDYVSALFGGKHYRDFFRLTRAFDYTWYGQFPLSEEGYGRTKQEFQQFKNTLAS